MIAVTLDKLAGVALKLPSALQTFSKLEAMLRDANRGLDDITTLIRADMSLSATVIRLANSALFVRGSPVSALEDAINRVGFREVHRLVALAAASNLFQRDLVFYGYSASQVWENALATAVAAEVLARVSSTGDTQVAYTTGLLRNLGKLILNNLLFSEPEHLRPSPYEASKGDVIAWEKNTTGFANPEIAVLVLEKWKYPAATIQPIAGQYLPHKAGRFQQDAARINLAGWIADQLGKALPGEQPHWQLTPQRLTEANLREPDVRDAILATRNALNELKAALAAL
jgi:HD-like signal output (HDOD) protein